MLRAAAGVSECSYARQVAPCSAQMRGVPSSTPPLATTMTCARMRWVAKPRTKAGKSRDRCFPSLCAGMITEIDGSTCMGDPVVQRLQRLRAVLETESLLDGRPCCGTHPGPELRR